ADQVAPGRVPLVLGDDALVLLLGHVLAGRTVRHPEPRVGGAGGVDAGVLEDVVRLLVDAGDVEAAVAGDALGEADVRLVGVRRLERRIERVTARAAADAAARGAAGNPLGPSPDERRGDGADLGEVRRQRQ